MLPRERLILLVDDQAEGRELLREAFEQHGYAVVEAENGKSALDRMRLAPTPDLVILDLNMPVMSGKEVLAAMRGDETLALLPVLVFSGTLGMTIPLDTPVVRHLSKPCTLARLLASVDECLEQ